MLASLLPADIFAACLVFARLGTAIMLLPGIGEAYVAMRIRLVFALAMTLLTTPIVAPSLPALPSGVVELLLLLGGEIVVGLYIGTVMRIMLTALQTAGSMVSLQMGLSSAQIFNPLMAEQSAILSSLYSVVGVLLIFVTDLHQPMLRALVDSYSVFIPGALPPAGDFSNVIAQAAADSFRLGIEMAAPFIILGTIFYVAVGFISRLAPQLQILFVIQPLQIIGGLVALALLMATGMQWFLDRFAAGLTAMLGV